MNTDTTKEQLNQLLSLITESLSQGKDFVLEQAPLIAQEIVQYGRVTKPITTVACAIAVIFCFVIINRGFKTIKNAGKYEDCEIFKGSCYIVSGGLTGGCFIVGFCQSLQECILVWFAPRLYIIEYIKDFVN